MAMDKLTLRAEQADDRAVLHVGGEFDLEVAGQVSAALQPLIEQVNRPVAIDLRELTYIDSTGIGILISAAKALHARGIPFGVEQAPSHIRKLFDMTGITPFLIKSESAK